MEAVKSIEIIESMLKESKKSLYRHSFYFILWGIMMIIAGLADYFFYGKAYFWTIWPSATVVGGIIASVYSRKEGKRSGTVTMIDRIHLYTWGAFGISLFLAIFYAAYNHLSPYPLVLLLAGSATFISGGISRFKPFIWGGLVLEAGSVACAYFIDNRYHGLVFALCIFLAYVIPGLILRKSENA
ncbi:MAG: YfhO family protein [Chlorobi bacterium]|nr:YfhO family protein [Chlorobiota bacterium]